MDGALPEADIKQLLRAGAAVSEVVVVATDDGGGIEFFPFLRMDADEGGFLAVRKGRGEGLISFASMTVLLKKLRAEPITGIRGGFGWSGKELRVVFQGHSLTRFLGPAAERWR